MQLLSKHTYELIYNRINNDLLLWEPSAPKQQQQQTPMYDLHHHNIIIDDNNDDVFRLCKSGIHYGKWILFDFGAIFIHHL